LLLLDEPLANLDPLARREFIHVLLDAIRKDGSTALLSSHIVTDVEEACDRLTILGSGKVLLDCPLDVARRGHRMTEGDEQPAGATAVGSFAGRGGKRMTLWRLATDGAAETRTPAGADEGGTMGYGGATGIPADGAPVQADDRSGPDSSLEDVVLGYLAAGRGVGAGLQLD
jgi:hypothetical protein